MSHLFNSILMVYSLGSQDTDAVGAHMGLERRRHSFFVYCFQYASTMAAAQVKQLAFEDAYNWLLFKLGYVCSRSPG